MKSVLGLFSNSMLALCLAMFGLLAAGNVRAATPGIVDHAHILQDDTVSKVSAAFGELKQKYQKDILIETYATIPSELKDKFTPEGKTQFFAEWAKTRETSEKVNGVYVLVCMDPTYLQVGVGDNTQKHAFTLADRDQLKQNLIAGLKAKKYDETMRALPGFFQSTFQTNLKTMHSQPVERNSSTVPVTTAPGAAQDTSSGGMGFMGIIVLFVCIIFGVMIFSFIARMIFGGGGGGSPGYAGGSGGGGGFFSGLLGGIGGAIAGNYIYDSLFRGDSHHSGNDANAAGQDNSGGNMWGNDNSTDSSFTNDGGGFDSGGGGDFGGGGDSGGGGDFGGGGGGDF